MSDHCPPTVPTKVAASRDGSRRRFFLGLAAFTLIRASEAIAAEQAVNLTIEPNRHEKPPPAISSTPFQTPFAARPFGGATSESTALSAALLPVPREYALPPAAQDQAFSNTDFRPRGRSILDKDPSNASLGDNLMVDKNVWQRLQEYRSRDRVRVLTLWESGASAISIQTNRKGDPYLQWTSRLMNRGGATRGLLDRWMPESVFRSFSHLAGKATAPSSPRPEVGADP